MERMNELWRDVGLPGTAPAIDPRRVKNRVNAALDADLGERKVYMKQKLRMALLLAAALAAVTGSALAASGNWEVLSAFFKGDTSPAQEYVNHTAYSVSDENYTFTVESSVADESTLYVVATVKALNEKSREALFDPWFHDMDTFNFYIPEVHGDNASGIYAGFGGGEVKLQSGDTRKFLLHANLSGHPDTIELWLGQMGRERSLTIPITPAPAVALALNATGEAVSDSDASPGSLTIRRLYLSPFNLRLEVSEGNGCVLRPRLLFRMADGSIRTQAQLMEFRESFLGSKVLGSGTDDYVQKYRFYEVQDLDNIASVIVFDVEYPLDGSAPFPVEHDPALDPFTVRKMERLSDDAGFSLPIRELTEKLGGTCHWDPETGDVTCTYRGVSIVLRPGEKIATVNGEPMTMWEAPAVQNGSLAASWNVFQKAWGIDGFVTYTLGETLPDPDDPGTFFTETFYHDWYVIP